jgi:hypothetical protein
MDMWTKRVWTMWSRGGDCVSVSSCACTGTVSFCFGWMSVYHAVGRGCIEIKNGLDQRFHLGRLDRWMPSMRRPNPTKDNKGTLDYIYRFYPHVTLRVLVQINHNLITGIHDPL